VPETRTCCKSWIEICSARDAKKDSTGVWRPPTPIRPAARKPLCPWGFRYVAARRRAGFPHRQLPAHALLHDKAFPQLGWTTGPVERVKFTRHGGGLVLSAGPTTWRKRAYALLGSCLSLSSNRRWRAWIRWDRRYRDGHGENPLRGLPDPLYRELGHAKTCLTVLRRIYVMHNAVRS
jgi:hypothetical protein